MGQESPGDESEDGFHGVEQRIGKCPLRPGLNLRDRYIVDRILGSGTRGMVWSAKRIEDNQSVVLKVSDDSKEFRHELWITSEGLQPLIRSPAAWESFNLMRKPWSVCVMELVGENLLGVFEEYKGQETKLHAAVKPLLEGLAAAHERKLAHCDIQPLNVCESADGSGAWRLIDWGMAEDMENYYADQKLGQGPKGCLLYQSPEMLAGLNWDRNTDVWSLGVILVELYLGEAWNAPRTWEESSRDILHTWEKLLGRLPAKLRKELGEYRGQLGPAVANRFFQRFPPLLADALRQMLQYSLKWRANAQDLLRHPWFALDDHKPASLEAWLVATLEEYEQTWSLTDLEKKAVVTVIQVLLSEAPLATAEQFMERAWDDEIHGDVGVLTLLVERLLGEQRVDGAEKWFLRMVEKDFKTPRWDEFVVEVVRMRAARSGFEPAEALLRKLDDSGVRLHSRAFTQLVLPTVKEGNHARVEEVLAWLSSKGFEPDAGFVEALLKSHANAPDPDPARAAATARRILSSAPVAVNGPVKAALLKAIGKQRFDELSRELDFEQRDKMIAEMNRSKGRGKGKGKRGR